MILKVVRPHPRNAQQEPDVTFHGLRFNMVPPTTSLRHFLRSREMEKQEETILHQIGSRDGKSHAPAPARIQTQFGRSFCPAQQGGVFTHKTLERGNGKKRQALQMIITSMCLAWTGHHGVFFCFFSGSKGGFICSCSSKILFLILVCLFPPHFTCSFLGSLLVHVLPFPPQPRFDLCFP